MDSNATSTSLSRDDAAEKICVIYAAGEYYGDEPDAAHLPAHRLVVAADGGFDHACVLGVTPDIVIGDFDSTSYADVLRRSSGATVIPLPAEHDDPDMLSAMKIGWRHGARNFHIFGGLGHRIDHSIANIQMLSLLAQHNAVGFLYGNGYITTAIRAGGLDFAARHHASGEMVSVFAYSDEVHDVYEKGLKYELNAATFNNTSVHGVSNEFLDGRKASIGVADGTLIVTFPSCTPLPKRISRLMPDKDGEALGPLSTSISSALAHPR
ncbi:thiamine diphosphokinase [Bifidobacterium bombi]|uniref:Thiamine diphosphokinase n=1 Tax=Bifidobacterium bombi DSM 19703 TaxID=1341695 RepID=A0A080N396_9BIFI|nr:thiamine diphosphokinase [Bifidobacterium bombi]KFF31421.1 thiamin pyrophosphokinase [Bifidobacterium bombi DSM 19703]